MARKNLQALLNKIEKESALKDEIRDLVNKRIHYYDLRFKNLVEEVYDEIRGTFAKATVKRLELTEEQKSIIVDEAKKYFKELRDAFTRNKSIFKVDVLANNSYYFSVKISSRRKGSNIFDNFITANRREPLNKFRASLFNRLQPTFDTDITSRTGILLQTGHKAGSSIAEQRVKSYLKSLDIKIKNIKKNMPPGLNYNPVYNLEAAINNSSRLGRVRQVINITDVYTSEQGRESNRTQGIEEKRIISSIRGKLRKALAQEDWINFQACSSPMEVIEASIYSAAGKSKHSKVPKKTIVTDSYKSKTKGTKGKIEGTSTKDSIKLDANIGVDNTPDNSGTNITDWYRILPLINAKLPPRVIANMKYPSLVNRTGTFGNSAKIVNVEQTREGFPTFVFDYERNPYDVFDRTLGRSPWNTPQRDPRALVDKSVRELVREMAIGRFYTRRA